MDITHLTMDPWSSLTHGAQLEQKLKAQQAQQDFNKELSKTQEIDLRQEIRDNANKLEAAMIAPIFEAMLEPLEEIEPEGIHMSIMSMASMTRAQELVKQLYPDGGPIADKICDYLEAYLKV